MTVITAENLGKKYTIGHQRQGNYVALRDVLAHTARGVWQRLRHPLSPNRETTDLEEVWALKDVNFEIKQGERVGIIGRNGAGKSTLLKILSRITQPTTGRVHIKGRVASLLEVGTGFHPELTGRENIYLNGAILGMTRQEIKAKFDEIVAFAEIEKFLDTPVKRYSSGMYVRLAFAVAAHLEPEILLVDEVLAVGDVQFQKKCLGKMGEVANEGRTVLFVSHNMAAVENLCRRGIVLQQGRIQYIGSQTEALSHYIAAVSNQTLSLRERTDRKGDGAIKVVEIAIKDDQGNTVDVVQSGQTIDICFYFETSSQQNYSNVLVSCDVMTQFGVRVFLHHNRLNSKIFGRLPEYGVFTCRIYRLPLPESTYIIGYSIMQGLTYLDSIADAMRIDVISGDFYNSGEIPPISHGVCLVEAQWYMESF